MHRARSTSAISDVDFAFDPLALQHFFDMRPNCLETFFAHDFNDRFAADFFCWPAQHLGVGAADESEAEIARAASKHKWGAIDNRFELDLLGTQRFFGRFALAQIND